MNGFENINRIVALHNMQSIEAARDYLFRYPTWNLLYRDNSWGYRWIFAPPGKKGVESTEAYDFTIRLKGDNQIYYLIFPDERLMMKYVNQLSEDKTFILKEHILIEGTQHYVYSSSTTVIEFGEGPNNSFYITFYTRSAYNNGIRIS